LLRREVYVVVSEEGEDEAAATATNGLTVHPPGDMSLESHGEVTSFRLSKFLLSGFFPSNSPNKLCMHYHLSDAQVN
jgi:hypothetical protein